MLVYEFMHNGTLKEHLYGNISFNDKKMYCSVLVYCYVNKLIFSGVVPRDRRISWIKRLEIAEDAARGS